MCRDTRRRDVFDRVAEGPVANVVKEAGQQKRFGLFVRNDLCEAIVAAIVLQKEQGSAVDAQGMFKAVVSGAGVNGRHQTELTDRFEPLEFYRVDDAEHTRRDWHVDLVGNADDVAFARSGIQFIDVLVGFHADSISSSRQWSKGFRLSAARVCADALQI